ncbi:PAS domain S-box protein [Thermodesulfobacteriota bacterium]
MMNPNPDKNYKLEDLIDIKLFQNLQDRLNEIYSFPSSIIDNDGNILTATAWQDICTNFHRKNKECEKACSKSDKYIQAHLDEANPAVTYHCPHGLVDNATPIIIDGVHYGNFFTGQFFLEEPVMDFFKKQAKKHGFPEKAYLEAVKKVPVWSKEQLDSHLFFIKGLITIISESGLKNLKEIESRKQIQESEELYRSVVEMVSDGVVLQDASGKILSWNKGVEEIFGITSDDAIRKTSEGKRWPTIHEDGSKYEGKDHPFMRTLRTGKSYKNEIMGVSRPSGDLKWISINTMPIFKDNRKKPSAVFISFSDITESKLIQEKLKSQAKTLDSIFNSAPNILLLVNSEGRVEKINHIGIEFTGREEVDIIGLLGGQVINCINSFDGKGCGLNEECSDCTVRSRVEDTLLTGASHDNEEGHMTFLKGEEKITLDLLISTRLIESNGNKQVLVSLTNITKLKETEKSLKKSQEQYILAVRGSQDGIWDRDLRDNSLYLSPRWKEILGYEDHELPNAFSTFENLLHPDDKSRILDNIRNYLNDQIPVYSIEFRLQHKDGSYRWILARGEALRDENGIPYRMAGSHTDITEHKRNEKYYRMITDLVDIAPNAITIHDFEGNFYYANRKASEIHGYTPEEFMKLNLFDLHIPEEEILTNERREIVDKKGEVLFSANHIRKDGSIIPMEVYIKKVAWEDNPAILAVATDISERRQAETALQESERRFRTIVENVLDGMFIHDFKGKIIDVNETACKMVGYNRSELIGMNISMVIPLKDRSKFPKRVEQLLIANSVVIEGEYLRKDSFLLPVEVSAKVVTHKENGLIQAFARDITQRKEAEAKLIFQAKLLDSVEQSVVVTDQNGRIIYWNPYSEKLYGMKESEAIGSFIMDTTIPQLNENQLNEMIDRLNEGKSWSAELSFQGKNEIETVIQVVNSPIFDENGELAAIIGIATDISEHKKDEQELDKVKNSLDEAQRIANVGNWEWDLRTNEIWWSDGLYRIWDREKSDGPLSADDIMEHIHPDDIKKLEKVMEESYKTGKYNVNYRLIRYNDKALRQIDSEGEIIYDDKGTPIKHFGVARDVTKERNLESQLQQAQKMESIGTLAGGIAHDFNNILSPIMLHSEMAMDELPPDDPLQHSMKEIFKAGERARDLVKQILTVARKKSEEKIALKSSLIVKEVINFLRSTIPATIDMQYHFKAKQDTILADPTQLNQILMNLCTNAAHAMGEKGGELEVILDNEDVSMEKAKRSLTLSAGRHLKISVRDTGTGISPQVIDRIFEPYFTTKQTGEGTGLGLAIINGIVQNYGGDIDVESEAGKGTTFHVYLPLIDVEISDTEEQKIKTPFGNERILFVDDEKAAVDAMQEILERLGYKVTPRTSSVEALEAFRNNPDAFDIVITDMTMPNMTGKELASELKMLRPDIPIILCTGYSVQIDEKEAKKIGIDAFIMKPIIMNEMAKIIRELLDR